MRNRYFYHTYSWRIHRLINLSKYNYKSLFLNYAFVTHINVSKVLSNEVKEDN